MESGSDVIMGGVGGGGGNEAGGGGFIPASLPSPPASSVYSTSTVAPNLPQQRKQALRPGSAKETTVINFVDSHILAINRRHAKKFSSAFAADESEADRGYENFREVAKDIEAIVDVLWVSGTPSLQIPYLISLAGLLNTYLPDFPFSARATFKLLRKFDSIFASLLLGEDLQTGHPLPGFEGKLGVVSVTEKVRIKSLAESARIIVVSAQEKEDEEDGVGMGRVDDGDDDDDDDDGGGDWDGDSEGGGGGRLDLEGFGDELGRWEVESGRVYERTIQILGDELGKQDG
ncbi:ribosomal RNA-processing protein 7 [Blastomyces parvus]|uniref:Ribosomal RNA-processing protein 7 n=1 Tax=Blastomyces parvus TaxID=2060905 RepID=A0A2B7XBU0_9EURO|nr:ribosomal RNA-processing protein 7 [Blastomyces parvus]